MRGLGQPLAWLCALGGGAVAVSSARGLRRARRVAGRLVPRRDETSRSPVLRRTREAVDEVLLTGLVSIGERSRSLGLVPRDRRRDASSAVRSVRRVVAGVGLVLVAGVSATAGPAAAIASVLALTGTGAAVVSLAGARRERAVDEALPVVIDRVAVALRAGLTVLDGLRDGVSVVSGPLRGDLERVVGAVGSGQPLVAALRDWQGRRDLRGVRLVVAALTLGLDVGPRVRPLEGVAATLRGDLVARQEVRAAAAQAQAQAVVMIGAPIVFVAANAIRDPAGFGATITRPLGCACLAGAALLDGAGAWWMSRLVRSAR